MELNYCLFVNPLYLSDMDNVFILFSDPVALVTYCNNPNYATLVYNTRYLTTILSDAVRQI